MGVLRMTAEHLTVIMGLNIPFIVITKVDIAPECFRKYKEGYRNLWKSIKSVNV